MYNFFGELGRKFTFIRSLCFAFFHEKIMKKYKLFDKAELL